MSLPVVPIVGRVNVGKSSLFNRLIGRRLAIEDPTPGVTRDTLSAVCDLSDKPVELVDTGGLGQETDPFTPEVERRVRAAVAAASCVVFVVDARAGCLPLDEAFARELRAAGKPVVLAANKADAPRHAPLAADFARLGLGEATPVSAATGEGVADLAARVARVVPRVPPAALPARRMRVAVVGRPNVGKSTWVNAVLGEDRLITSPVPGTTRDAVETSVQRGKRLFTLVDTAGLRKERAVQDAVDFYAQARAREAIRTADAVLFLVDALSEVSRVDRAVSREIVSQAKPAVLGVNKWDRVPPGKRDDFLRYVADRFPELAGCPVAFTSGLSCATVWETMDLVWELGRRARVWWDAASLRETVEAACARNAPRAARAARTRLSINGVRQVGVAPVRIELHTNRPDLWRPADVRMLVGAIRAAGPWGDIPIQLRLVGHRRAPRKGTR